MKKATAIRVAANSFSSGGGFICRQQPPGLAGQRTDEGDGTDGVTQSANVYAQIANTYCRLPVEWFSVNGFGFASQIRGYSPDSREPDSFWNVEKSGFRWATKMCGKKRNESKRKIKRW